MMVFFSSWASGMMQNGAFSWVNGFDPINTQGLMVGQGVAGVLPAIARMYINFLDQELLANGVCVQRFSRFSWWAR